MGKLEINKFDLRSIIPRTMTSQKFYLKSNKSRKLDSCETISKTVNYKR